MRKRIASCVGLAAVFAALAAQPAAAAMDFGNSCASNSSGTSIVAVGLANAPGNPLSATVPSTGVITRWTFNLGAPIPPGMSLQATLKVFRATGVPGQLLVAGESALETVTSSTQSFSSRIPVQAGDMIGEYAQVGGSSGAFYCATPSPGDRVAIVPAPAAPGSTVPILEEPTSRAVPIVASVEADVDHDGYGDETQDKCPQSAAYQTPCPVIALGSVAVVGKGKVTAYVASSLEAPVTVSGSVKLAKGKAATLSGGTLTIAPGSIAGFTLRFSKQLKAKLKELPRGKKLSLKVTASASNITGPPSTSVSTVKLAGTAPPRQ